MSSKRPRASLSSFRLKPLAVAIMVAHSPLVVLAQEATEERDPDGRVIEEVIVTATKREANMQDLAQSITAFTTDDLERLRARDMKEYIDALPSIALVNSVPGRNSIVFRGVSTGSSEYRTDSMTAVYLDEQPLTTNSQQVDPWLVDIERVEALPGPQGTLFGSSSQSGTLRVITNKPDPSGFSAQVDASAYATRGGEPSHDLSGHVNVPLGDRFAVRIAAFASHEGGYVDNILGRDLADTMDNADAVEDDFNEYDVSGGRIAATWDVGERWSVIAGLIAQNSSTTGSWESDPSLGDFKIVKFFDEYRDDDWQQTSLTFKGDLGGAEFSATSAVFDRDIAYEWDNHVYEQYKDAYWGVYSGYGLYNSEYTFGTTFNDQQQERFSQEVRLTSTGESRFQWMVGAFYEDVDDDWFFGAQNPALMDTIAWEAANYYAYTYYASYDHLDYPLAPTDIGFSNHFVRAVRQTAVFGELAYDLSDRLTTTVGLRWFEYDRNEFDQFQVSAGVAATIRARLGRRLPGLRRGTGHRSQALRAVHGGRRPHGLRPVQPGVSPGRLQQPAGRRYGAGAAQLRCRYAQQLRGGLEERVVRQPPAAQCLRLLHDLGRHPDQQRRAAWKTSGGCAAWSTATPRAPWGWRSTGTPASRTACASKAGSS